MTPLKLQSSKDSPKFSKLTHISAENSDLGKEYKMLLVERSYKWNASLVERSIKSEVSEGTGSTAHTFSHCPGSCHTAQVRCLIFIPQWRAAFPKDFPRPPSLSCCQCLQLPGIAPAWQPLPHTARFQLCWYFSPLTILLELFTHHHYSITYSEFEYIFTFSSEIYTFICFHDTN